MGETTPAFLFSLLNYTQEHNIAFQGHLHHDFITNYAFRGYCSPPFEEQIAILKASFSAVLEAQKQIPSSNYQIITIDSGAYAEAGCTAVQELAYSLALGVQYLNPLIETFELNDLVKSIVVTTKISTNYFLELAKLRAFRLLWNHLLQTYQEQSTPYHISIHTEVLNYEQPSFDLENNLIRSTIQAMASSIGGADSILFSPFNQNVLDEQQELGETTALHLSHLLKHESYLNEFADPAEGSYYIEYLTQSLCEKAWAHFQTIEAKGGILKALESNTIQTEIEQEAQLLKADFKDKKKVVVGVNIYPNTKKYTPKPEVESLFTDPYKEKTSRPLQFLKL